ncbi:acyltransferase [Pediococcus acidilactici]|uniref:acyltransferase family protein n=2 Tax=Lactobacillaceae TaxID=33958 RepID=UPI0005609912|nr:acyltransferase [Pediococcus acidilactici]MBM6603205.1 acyltransferase [Pediococcus acidilactici]MBM6642822.1 acyltransferase [Pediococcus acidilactici]MCB5791746.1 acyltransferase [Pediococcus acidilactici]MCB5808127.1 acyltransferase [Pediococcus acidilactici]
MMIKKRIDWIDYLKAFSVISVVAFHVMDGMHYEAHYSGFIYVLITTLTKGVALSAFFLASGLFANSWLKKEKKFLLKVKALLVPYFIWSIVYGLLNILGSSYVNHRADFSFIYTILVSPKWHFWFLYYLFWYFVFFAAIQKLRQRTQMLVIGSGFILGLVFPNFWILNNFFPYFIAFYVGTYFKEIKDQIQRDSLLRLALMALPLYAVYSYCLEMNYELATSLLIPLAGITSAFFFIKLFMQVPHMGWLQYLGQRTMPIYLLHVFFTAPTRIVLLKLNIQNVGINVLVGILAGLVMPLLVYVVAQKLKINKILFGS